MLEKGIIMANFLHSETIDELTPKFIQAILNEIRFSRTLPNSLLNEFLIVQAQMPVNFSHMMYNYVLVDWLSNEIMNQYNQQRHISQLPKINHQCNYPTVLNNLVEDFTQNNEHLEAWSTLFHRYVRVDLHLSTSDFQNAGRQSGRNIRRRQRLGYTLLCHHLLSLERTALEHKHPDY